MSKRLIALLTILMLAAATTVIASAENAAVKASAIEFVDLDQVMYVGIKYPLNVATTLSDSPNFKMATTNKLILGLARDKDSGGFYAIARKPGVAKLTASITASGKLYKVTKTVVVKKLAVKSVSVSASLSLSVGESATLEASVAPARLSTIPLTWTSGNTAVAVVSKDGVVTGKSAGTAVIKVKAGNKYAKCAVTVTAGSQSGNRRGFLFGMSQGDDLYTDFGFDALTSVYQEVNSVNALFRREGIDTQCVLNATRSRLLSAMNSFASDGSDSDVTYVYYSGHGTIYKGTLNLIAGIDAAVSAKELRSALDKIPGKVVLFLNCCQSGSSIGKSVSDDAFTQAFLAQFIGAVPKSSEFISSKYTVICACKSSEYGWVIDNVDVFADALSDGLGWDLLAARSSGDWLSDANGDGSVTAYELTQYMRKSVNAMMAEGALHDPDLRGETQTIVTYPARSTQVLFGGVN